VGLISPKPFPLWGNIGKQELKSRELFRLDMARPVVIITGGGKRIGAAISTAFLELGWHVIIHVNNSQQEAQQLLDVFEQKNGTKPSAEIVKCDFQDDEQLQQFISQIKGSINVVEAGGISAIIHNASFYIPKGIEQISLADIRLMNRIHIEVPFLITQAFIAKLKAVNGSVIGIVDTSLGRSWNGLSHYTSSKAALRQLMMNFAGELAPEIRVNCIAPGAVLAADWEAPHYASIIEKVPLGREGDPQDVAKAILFLVNSPHISGQVITVDGGWSINS
jgi:pteridine reductase